jgi:hypothetical protein
MKTLMRGWTIRRAAAALLSVLVLVLAGDRGAYTAVPSGIDPLEVLNLSVRANAIIVLDSSGSMRETPDSADNDGNAQPDDPDDGEVVGDDPTSKLHQAKAVLRTVVQANESKVSFQFGRYQQDTTQYGPEAAERFLYTASCAVTDAACNAAANDILVTNTVAPANCGGANCGIGLYRIAAHRFTSNGTTYYHLFANQFFNGQRITVRQNGSAWDAVLDAGDFGPSTPAPNGPGPWVEVRNRNNANPFAIRNANYVRFRFQGIRWNKGNANSSCGGFQSLVNLQPCTENVQIDSIGPHLDDELELNANGNIVGYTNGAVGSAVGVLQQPPMRGIRASGFTPIAESLIDVKGVFNALWGGSIAAMNPKPRTFVIFVTDGDDTCTSQTTTDTSAAGADNRALRAAHKAQLLYQRIAAAEPASSVTTFVVAFGTGASAARANWVAWGGSGMVKATSGAGAAMQWASPPTAAERAACTTCRDAFVATNAAELSNALQVAIDQGQSAGEFSDQQSITESIFEYAPVTGESPFDPHRRYELTLPILLQSTFVLPGWEGHLKAFRNVSNTSALQWDAATALQSRQSTVWTGWATFPQLHNGATPDTIGTSNAYIKRRIYTTTRNGVFVTGADSAIVTNLTTPRYQPTDQVALWPPAAVVDPAPAGTSYPAGVLDDELGIMTQTFAQLQAEFGACTSSVAANLHAHCAAAAGAATQLARARYEAREMILAHIAGAEVVKNGTVVVRTAVVNGGLLQFQKRASLLAESTLAAPAVVTPPPERPFTTHVPEYKLYRDGPRGTGDVAQNGIANGFGLRNPDLDASAPGTGADPRTALKPVMSVVYHVANDMLHAFRAGPQDMSGGTCTVSPTNECGGEELWGYVPYDQLGKMKERMKPQARDPHTYVLAAPVRVADVWVNGSFSRTIGGVSVSGDGVWRTVIIFGRGIAGKHMTALDITAPGPFNTNSLTTAPPISLWNRGNPDTQDGFTTGTRNNTVGDYNAYATMGQTWSVPAIGFVTAAENATSRKPQGVEFVGYMGSGYGSGANAANEGTFIYTIDVLTGDIIAAVPVGDRAGMPFENAIVASPAGFSERELQMGPTSSPLDPHTTRVYVGDIHGRVWRMSSNAPSAAPLLFGDLGANQPVGNGVALLNYQGSGTVFYPHVFVESGNDNRVTPPPQSTPPFRLYGLRDEDLASDPSGSDGVNGPARVLFSIDLPDGFRGNVQPATSFTNTNPPAGRVFFAATRFNLPGTPNAPPPPPCRSSFDSLLGAVGAETGQAAYDLNSSGDDRFLQINQQRIQAVRVSGGQLVVDMGLGAQNPPPPPAPPSTQPPQPNPLQNVWMGAIDPATGTPKIAGLIPYKLGSSVCR